MAALLLVAISPATAAKGAVDPAKYGAIVIDAHTDKVLFSRNADTLRYPASLTKVMTLYMLFDAIDAGKVSEGTRMHVSRYASQRPPSKLGLRAGSSIRVRDAIRALVTKSANDVATVVAEHLGGTESEFAVKMTRTARALGMSNTTFKNASGLPNSRQRTTARDMALLAKAIRRDFPHHYAHFSLTEFTYNGKRYKNHNKLLGRYAGTTGLKTGYTRASGFNLTATVERDGRSLIAVVLGGRSGKSRDRHMVEILDKAMPRAVARAGQRTRLAAIPVPRDKPGTAAGSAPVAVAAVGRAAGEVASWIVAPAAASEGVSTTELVAALPPAPPAPEPSELFSDDSWIIQIGAYSDPVMAVDRLRSAVDAAPQELSSAIPVTVPVETSVSTLYRSRFGGFDEATARSACGRLTRANIPCITIPPVNWNLGDVPRG